MSDALTFESIAPSVEGKFKGIFEDLLDHKFQLLEDRLLQELVGIRADLLGRSPGQGSACIPEAERGASISQAQRSLFISEAASCHDSSKAPGDHPIEVHQTHPAFSISQADGNHSNGFYRTRSKTELDSQDTQSSSPKKGECISGVAALLNKEGNGAERESVRAIPHEIVAKFQLRNELAAMKKEKAIYHLGLLSTLEFFSYWWQNLNEPERKGCIANLVQAKSFEGLCILVIIVNSVFIAVAADWEIRHIGQILGCLDLMVMITEQTAEGDSPNDKFALGRIARLLKLTKMFRTMRALRFFKDLVVIMESVANSLAALFWILIMLGIVLFIFALVFVQGTIDYMQSVEGGLEEQDVEEIYRYFGSMWASTMSMYSAVTGGNDWLVYYEIIAKFGAVYAGMFMGFMFFFLFAMFNILTGLFVEKATVASKPDADQIIITEKNKFLQQHSELHALCVMLDENETGFISWGDFERMMSNPTVVACMSSIGLEVHEPELFFEMICDSSEELTLPIDTFVDRCMKMKGLATSIDTQRSLFELYRLRRQIQSMSTALRARCPQPHHYPYTTEAFPLCQHLEVPPDPPDEEEPTKKQSAAADEQSTLQLEPNGLESIVHSAAADEQSILQVAASSTTALDVSEPNGFKSL